MCSNGHESGHAIDYIPATALPPPTQPSEPRDRACPLLTSPARPIDDASGTVHSGALAHWPGLPDAVPYEAQKR